MQASLEASPICWSAFVTPTQLHVKSKWLHQGKPEFRDLSIVNPCDPREMMSSVGNRTTCHYLYTCSCLSPWQFQGKLATESWNMEPSSARVRGLWFMMFDAPPNSVNIEPPHLMCRTAALSDSAGAAESPCRQLHSVRQFFTRPCTCVEISYACCTPNKKLPCKLALAAPPEQHHARYFLAFIAACCGLTYSKWKDIVEVIPLHHCSFGFCSLPIHVFTNCLYVVSILHYTV